MESRIGPLVFKTIDLATSLDVSLRFRENSFIASFGDSKRFYQEDGKGAERYVEWLRGIVVENPGAAVHAWEGDRIVGQLEMGIAKSDPTLGMVFLYYLEPEARGRGLSRFLDEYAITFLRDQGLLRARLNVSPTNARAIRFYEKQGWVSRGPNPKFPDVVHFMERELR